MLIRGAELGHGALACDVAALLEERDILRGKTDSDIDLSSRWYALRKGKAQESEQLRIARVATVILALIAIGLGILFKGQNVAFMVGLAFAIAASANFPALLLSMTWGRFSTAGAVWSMLVGTLSAILLIALSPTVQIELLHHTDAIFPMKNPAVVTMTLSFAAGIVASLIRPDEGAARKFAEVERRIQLGSSDDDRQSTRLD